VERSHAFQGLTDRVLQLQANSADFVPISACHLHTVAGRNSLKALLMGIFRFLLAMAVVVGHTGSKNAIGYTLLPGYSAVQGFYIISGFFITMVLNERSSYRSTINFYISRYMRLWPAYVVIAVASALWSLDFHTAAPMAAESLAFMSFANATLFFQDSVMFLRLDGEGHLSYSMAAIPNDATALWRYLLVPQAWTLGVELTFYAIAPFICRSWQKVLLLVVFGIAVRFLMIYFDFVPDGSPFRNRFAPAEMMLFGAGGLAYFVGNLMHERFPGYWKSLGLALLAVLVGIVVGWGVVGRSMSSNGLSDIVAKNLFLFNFTFLAIVALAISPIFHATRNISLDRHVGELSYPVYISHKLVLGLALGSGVHGALYLNLVVWVVVVLAAYILYLTIDVPVDRLRRRFGARSENGPQETANG
jgi:peptidoglycan/LPS O-acetylase OafA/YrhL